MRRFFSSAHAAARATRSRSRRSFVSFCLCFDSASRRFRISMRMASTFWSRACSVRSAAI